MTKPFESYNYTLEVVTPVHIGGAKENDYLRGSDFYYDDDTKEYVFFNQSTFLKALNNQQLKEYTNALRKGDIDESEKISSVICGKNPTFVINRSYCPFFKSGARYDAKSRREVSTYYDDIRRHYSTGLGKLTIPGSSIKGALRSVIGNYIINEANIRPKENRDFDSIFGRISGNLMHYLQVSDVELGTTSSIIPFKTFSGDIKNSVRVTPNGLEYEGKGMWKFQSGQGERTHEIDFKEEGFVFLYETCIMGSIGNLRLNWAKGLNELTPENKKPNNYRYYDAIYGNTWMGIARKQMNTYLEQEIVYFKKFPNSDFSNSVELLEKLQQINNEPNSILLRIGMGSGYHAITGNWRFKDHTQTGQAERKNRETRQFEKINAIKYKTRKVSFIEDSTEDLDSIWIDLPGFVKITHKT